MGESRAARAGRADSGQCCRRWRGTCPAVAVTRCPQQRRRRRSTLSPETRDVAAVHNGDKQIRFLPRPVIMMMSLVLRSGSN